MDLPYITTVIQTIASFLVSVTALAAAIIGFVGPIRNWFVNLFRAYSNKDVNIRMDKMELKVNKISDFIDAVQVKLTNKFNQDESEQQRVQSALVAVLRNQMLAIFNRSDERGYIGDWDRDNFEQMFKIYIEMGGNSYMHTVHEKILLMPRVPKTKKKRR